MKIHFELIHPKSLKFARIIGTGIVVFLIQLGAYFLLQNYISYYDKIYLLVITILLNVSIVSIFIFEFWNSYRFTNQINKYKMELIRFAVELDLKGKNLDAILSLESNSEKIDIMVQETAAKIETKKPSDPSEIEQVFKNYKDLALVKKVITTANSSNQTTRVSEEYYSKEMFQFVIEQIIKK